MIKWMFFPYGVGGLGLFFYVSRVPECVVSAGKVDLCGASHQIWHMLIFAGILVMNRGLLWKAIELTITPVLAILKNIEKYRFIANLEKVTFLDTLYIK